MYGNRKSMRKKKRGGDKATVSFNNGRTIKYNIDVTLKNSKPSTAIAVQAPQAAQAQQSQQSQNVTQKNRNDATALKELLDKKVTEVKDLIREADNIYTDLELVTSDKRPLSNTVELNAMNKDKKLEYLQGELHNKSKEMDRVSAELNTLIDTTRANFNKLPLTIRNDLEKHITNVERNVTDRVTTFKDKVSPTGDKRYARNSKTSASIKNMLKGNMNKVNFKRLRKNANTIQNAQLKAAAKKIINEKEAAKTQSEPPPPYTEP